LESESDWVLVAATVLVAASELAMARESTKE
jgi:hypothetical protein